ncbi:MAG: hypothetical protein ACYC5O_04655 [Anaerolineae bacterium]
MRLARPPRWLPWLALFGLLVAPWAARAQESAPPAYCGLVSSDRGAVGISSPGPGDNVEGEVAIEGTATLTRFTYYKVEYSVDCSEWVTVDRDFRHRPAVSEGLLATWDTVPIANGSYWLRAVVVDSSGNYLASVPFSVTVANPLAEPTATAAAAVAATVAATPAPSWLAAGPSGTVGIYSPEPGATISGLVDIEGTATNVPLRFAYYKVEYSADGGWTWGPVDEPFRHTLVVTEDVLATWDTTAVPDGPYLLRAVIVDKSGNYTISPVVPVTVANAAPSATAAARATEAALAPTATAAPAPTATATATPCPLVGCSPGAVDISAPVAGAAVSGVVTIEGSAAIPRFSYYKVEYSVDGVLWVSVEREYRHARAVSAGVLATWDTSVVADGAYRLRAVAVDSSGNYAESAVVAVTVANGRGP